MTREATFEELIRRVRAGDEAASAELLCRYEPAVRRVARIRLRAAHLQREFDSTDICQSVFGSFFVRAALGEYDLDSPEHVRKLLLAMTRKKVTDRVRGSTAARRDSRRVEDLGPEEQQCAAPGPTPGQQVAGAELLREFHRRLTQDERRLADLRADGKSWNEVAAALGGSPDALRKQLGRAIQRVAAELKLDEGW
jgi:RNA polymerase sigma-70 factor (ECF subfamily)